MDSETPCTEFTSDALVSYVYDECEPGERERVDAHVVTCHACSAELESLQAVRGTLPAWTAPDPVDHMRIVSDNEKRSAWWRTGGALSWGLAAAAALLLVVSAAVVSVEIRYDADGFAFRMGWPEQGGARGTSAGQAGQPDDVTIAADDIRYAGAEAPWLADLASLEDELRSELIRRAADETPVLEEVEGLIQDSERRQRQELALWFTEFAQEFDMQRRADQQRVQQDLGALEGVADYLVRVSQR